MNKSKEYKNGYRSGKTYSELIPTYYIFTDSKDEEFFKKESLKQRENSETLAINIINDPDADLSTKDYWRGWLDGKNSNINLTDQKIKL